VAQVVIPRWARVLVQAQVLEDVQLRWALFHRGLGFPQEQPSPKVQWQGSEILIATHLPKEDFGRLWALPSPFEILSQGQPPGQVQGEEWVRGEVRVVRGGPEGGWQFDGW
jgi:hypothetical protein